MLISKLYKKENNIVFLIVSRVLFVLSSHIYNVFLNNCLAKKEKSLQIIVKIM